MNKLKLYEAKKLAALGSLQYKLKICEETSELQTAYLHFLDHKAHIDDVIEEIADMLIQIDKIIYEISSFDDYETKIINYKIDEMVNKKLEHIKKIISDC